MSLLLITPTLITAIAGSANPFVAISLLVMAAMAWVAKNVYKDMQKDKEKAEALSNERELRLLERDEKQRLESIERERELREQIDKSNEAQRELSTVMNQSFERLGGVVAEIGNSQARIVETQKETYEAVQNLNQTVQILNYDMRDVKNRLESVERNLNTSPPNRNGDVS